MGIRHWLRARVEREAGEGIPAGVSIFDALFGKEEPTPHALGEYDANTYPEALADLLRRREEVAMELVELDLATAAGRQSAVPRLQELIHDYPHPLAYEALINAYVDVGRWDDARGVAFAARERRHEVARSPFPEIRCEIDRLEEWTPEEVDALRAEREARYVAPAPVTAPAAATPSLA